MIDVQVGLSAGEKWQTLDVDFEQPENMFAVMWSGHRFAIAVPPGREHRESGEIQELAELCVPRKCKMTPHTARGALAAFHVCREVAGRVTAVARLEIGAGTV